MSGPAPDSSDRLAVYLVEIGALTPEELAAADLVEAEEQPRCEVCRCTPARTRPRPSLLATLAELRGS